MTNLSSPYAANIRPIEKRKDLAAVANLIEMCFADTMDPDGRDYIRHLRFLAQGFTGWTSNPFERLQLPVQGFLWEEDGQVVGNLTLIPYSTRGRKNYLIANVATHPGYRRKGIARKLTLTGLDYARTHGASSVWLHVRDDNPGAQALYLKLGFEERFRRTLWQCESYINQDGLTGTGGVKLGRRQSHDWELQSAWLDRIYPPEVSWNLPLSKSRLAPGVLKSFQMKITGEGIIHLAARRENDLIGIVTWETSSMYADNLWLATDPAAEDTAVRILLPGIQKAIRRKRPLMVNYPAENAREAFRASRFYPHMTLIWMEVKFNNQGGV